METAPQSGPRPPALLFLSPVPEALWWEMEHEVPLTQHLGIGQVPERQRGPLGLAPRRLLVEEWPVLLHGLCGGHQAARQPVVALPRRPAWTPLCSASSWATAWPSSASEASTRCSPERDRHRSRYWKFSFQLRPAWGDGAAKPGRGELTSPALGGVADLGGSGVWQGTGEAAP
ncbi:unnamed protein product [Caretta caretta]